MAEKKYAGAPFGTQTARFDVTGVHPKTKTPGSFTQMPYDKYSMIELKMKQLKNVKERPENQYQFLQQITEQNIATLNRYNSRIENIMKSLTEADEIIAKMKDKRSKTLSFSTSYQEPTNNNASETGEKSEHAQHDATLSPTASHHRNTGTKRVSFDDVNVKGINKLADGEMYKQHEEKKSGADPEKITLDLKDDLNTKNSKMSSSETQNNVAVQSHKIRLTCDELLKRKLGPGTYNTMVGGFSQGSVELKSSGPGWARQLEVERLAALPHLLHKEQWEENKMLKRKLGPGSYEIKDFVQTADLKPRSERGICQNLAPRFSLGSQSATPGPGTYGIGGVPQRAIEEKCKISASTKGMLDAGDRKRNLPTVGSQLGPGTYQFKSCIDELKDKKTSEKGPYELYSGDRNKPISEGYLAAPKLADLGPGQYEIGSFVDNLKGPHKIMHGKFGKMAQYPEVPTDRCFLFSQAHFPKTKDSPGPGAYSAQELSKPRHLNSPGFLSSAKRDDKISQKFFTRNFNPVGAGRYDIQKFEEAQDVNGHTSVFKSKSGKPNLQMSKFLQERIRAKDVPPENRTFIQTPGKPPLCRSITVM